MEFKKKFGIEDAKKLRQICRDRIDEIDPDRNAALALSGGIDSMVILFTMIESGRKPHCYTFYMDSYVSEDLKSARAACKYFGLELTEVPVPTDIDTIYQDVKRVIPHCAYIKKTIVECMIPWLYIYPKLKEPKIINGMAAGDLYQDNRKAAVLFSKYGDESIVKYRKFEIDDFTIAKSNIEKFAEKYQKENVSFYGCKTLQDFFLTYSYKCLNNPKPKYPVLLAFRDYFGKGKFFRHPSNYQINSKLRDYYGKLIKSKYNTTSSKAVIGIYNQIAKEMGLWKKTE